MVMTDPIADFLTRIRNANMVKHETLEVPASKIKRDIAEILKREGFIRDVEYIEDDKQGISKPGLRAYVKADEVPKVLNGLGIAIISTSEGVITDKEARAKNIGGEVIAYVW